MTTTELVLFVAFGIALGYAFYLKEKLSQLALLLRVILDDESKYRIVRKQHEEFRKHLASNSN